MLLYLLTHLSPGMCLNLGEFELSVVGVHLTDLLSGRSTENLREQVESSASLLSYTWKYTVNIQAEQVWSGNYLNNFNQLIHTTVAREDWLS